MKSLNDHNHNSNGISHNDKYNNWLGFSLSAASAQLPSSFYNLCCENGGLPLKADGSLCIMEALTHSQTEGMVPNTSPKLEDFLGGASMGDYNENTDAQHHYYSGIPYNEAYQPHNVASYVNTMHYSNADVASHHHGLSQQQQQMSSMSFGDLKTLSLSMIPGSQSSCVTASPMQISPKETECVVGIETKKRGCGKLGQAKQPLHRKSIDTFGQRTSQYRGVTRHRWTGRYEAHLWDNSCKKEGQTRKGRQVYLGGYDMEEKAARAYDLAAIKYWGSATHINFSLDDYATQIEEMKNMNRQEYVAHLRRKSSGFSRGASIYRGVTRHHQHGRWQARIGRVAGNKDLYLGTFSTQEEAAEAYDVAAIKFRGVNAVTNFDITRYDVEKIVTSNTLLAGESARRNKEAKPKKHVIEYSSPARNNVAASPLETSRDNSSDWKMALFQENAATCAQTLDQKLMASGNYRSPAYFSMALQDYMHFGSVNSSQQLMDDSANVGGIYVSNPSSLVTGLSSSREDSPDKMFYAKPPMASKFISSSSAAPVSSWFPSAQLRPSAATISMSQLPLFAAFSDT